MFELNLGFAEKCDSAWLTNRYFPSKIGGHPAWLELELLPTKESLLCANCNAPKAFLCQIYAPFDDAHHFHRQLYVFVCRAESCQQSNSAKNFSVLRSQLPRINDFYSKHAPKESGNPLPAIAVKRKLCVVCGCLGPLACARCKASNYCSAQHQRAHWPHHKKYCATSHAEAEPTIMLPQIVFPEYEIVVESNESEADVPTTPATKDEETLEKQRLAEFAELVAAGKTGALKDLADSELDAYASSSSAVDDKHFHRFRKEVDKANEQVLRYQRNTQPLWIADPAATVAAQLQVPNCEHCNAPRQFEFQIMPQMLLSLKDEQLDWGVLVVFTCEKSCQPPAGMGYLSEYIVKQDIVNTN